MKILQFNCVDVIKGGKKLLQSWFARMKIIPTSSERGWANVLFQYTGSKN